MKPLTYSTLALAALLTTPALAQRAAPPAGSAHYQLRGQVRGAAPGTKVFVVDALPGGRTARLDSATVDARGRFILRGTVGEPAVYYLGVEHKPELLAVPLAAGARLTVSGPAQDWTAAVAEGSAEAEALAAYERARQENLRRRRALMLRYDASRDAATRRALEQEGRELDAALAAATQHLARRPSYLAPYAALMLLGDQAQTVFLDSVTAVYRKIEPASRYTQALLARQRALALGAPAPELLLTGADGRLVPLSSLRGQYVLLNCRGAATAADPAWARLARQYHPQGLVVGHVAAADALARVPGAAPAGSWTNLAGLAARAAAGPATLLVDPQGRIVARNLRGDSLDRKVAALLR
jgi:hypothetical protein